MDGWKDGWMDGWKIIDGWMNRRTDSMIVLCRELQKYRRPFDNASLMNVPRVIYIYRPNLGIHILFRSM